MGGHQGARLPPDPRQRTDHRVLDALGLRVPRLRRNPAAGSKGRQRGGKGSAEVVARADGCGAPLVDYSEDYPKGTGKTVGQVSYAELKSGSFRFNGREVQAVPLSSMPRAREIAHILKSWIREGKFLLGEPQHFLPTA